MPAKGLRERRKWMGSLFGGDRNIVEVEARDCWTSLWILFFKKCWIGCLRSVDCTVCELYLSEPNLHKELVGCTSHGFFWVLPPRLDGWALSGALLSAKCCNRRPVHKCDLLVAYLGVKPVFCTIYAFNPTRRARLRPSSFPYFYFHQGCISSQFPTSLPIRKYIKPDNFCWLK